jgi:hypothetical protein
LSATDSFGGPPRVYAACRILFWRMTVILSNVSGNTPNSRLNTMSFGFRFFPRPILSYYHSLGCRTSLIMNYLHIKAFLNESNEKGELCSLIELKNKTEDKRFYYDKNIRNNI